jgi:hypothetical protein
VTVAVRLNITMHADLYQRLKRQLPARHISRFINDAVRAHLHPDRATLDAAYKAARKEAWRKELAGSPRPGNHAKLCARPERLAEIVAAHPQATHKAVACSSTAAEGA